MDNKNNHNHNSLDLNSYKKYFLNDDSLKEELIMYETSKGTFYFNRNKYESYEEALRRNNKKK